MVIPKMFIKIMSVRWLQQERDRLHQSICCRHTWPSASQWCVHRCVQVGANGPFGHFEHLIKLRINAYVVLHMLFVDFVNITQVCVLNAVEFRQCWSFIIHRVVQWHILRCDGNHDIDSVANFMENTTVKEFYKSGNMCLSYEQMYNGAVFLLTV